MAHENTQRLKMNTFISEHGLGGVVDLFQFLIKQPSALADFAQDGIEISESQHVLLHGTVEKREHLVPQIETGVVDAEKRIYATDDPNYAIFLAVLRLHNARASVSIDPEGQTILSVDTEFVNGQSKLVDGFVCFVAGDGFKPLENHEYYTTQAIKTLYCFPVSPSDLTVPIYIETS